MTYWDFTGDTSNPSPDYYGMMPTINPACDNVDEPGKGDNIVKYTDEATREMIGLSKSKAIAEANQYAFVNSKPTLAFFTRWDAELGNRHDWCTEENWDFASFGYNRPDQRIVWSSNEGEC